jgi:hypothetical protein
MSIKIYSHVTSFTFLTVLSLMTVHFLNYLSSFDLFPYDHCFTYFILLKLYFSVFRFGTSISYRKPKLVCVRVCVNAHRHQPFGN